MEFELFAFFAPPLDYLAEKATEGASPFKLYNFVNFPKSKLVGILFYTQNEHMMQNILFSPFLSVLLSSPP